MGNKTIPILLFLLFCFFLIVQCQKAPNSDFFEVDGILSIDPAVVASGPNWLPILYMNSKGLISHIKKPDSASSSSLTFYISNPGYYSFWYLSPEGNSDEQGSSLGISISGPDGFLTAQFVAESYREGRLKWRRPNLSQNESGRLYFPETGQYSFTMNSRGTDSLQIHKIHMSYEDFNMPAGAGLPPSLSQDFNAEEIHREKMVMLPPRWAFGVLIGTNQQAGNIDTYLNQLKGLGLSGDAIWLSNEFQMKERLSDNSTADEGSEKPIYGLSLKNEPKCNQNTEEYYDLGYRFLKAQNISDHTCLEEMIAEQILHFDGLERGVFLKSIGALHNPKSGEVPLPSTAAYRFDWTGDTEVERGEYLPGGLRELVEDVSNPDYSLYGTPFVSHPVDFASGISKADGFDKDLFMQYLQVLAFTPVMQLINVESVYSHQSGNKPDADELLRIQEIIKLRKQLFPYHYSHAHETRQVNESVVEGARDTPGQYLYGDAFLVAPLMESGSNGRVVHFPGGRLWYDYHSAESYEAGQSWFIEASPHETPLFVKAGSVIPYLSKKANLLHALPDDYLKVEVYTGDAGTFRLVEDDGFTRDYRRAIAARTMFRYNEIEGQLRLTIGAVQKYFNGMSERRTYDLHFMHTLPPVSVAVNGENLFQNDRDTDRFWSYDDQKSKLILTLKEQSKHQKLDIVITPSVEDRD